MALHAIWCTLAPLHWIKRFLVGAKTGFVLYGVLVAGYAFCAFHFDLTDVEDVASFFVIGLLCLPLLLLAAQTPLWIMRIWFRWRIAHRDDEPSTTFQSLRISDLMIAMAVIAAALAAAQISQSISAPSGNGSIVGLAVVALIVMAASGIIVLPLVVATLRARRMLMALGLVLSVDIAIVIGYVALMVILADVPVNWETFVVIPTIIGSFFVSLTAPMLIARKFGYRLQWGRR